MPMKTTCDKCGRTKEEHQSILHSIPTGPGYPKQMHCYFCRPKRDRKSSDRLRKKYGKPTFDDIEDIDHSSGFIP